MTLRPGPYEHLRNETTFAALESFEALASARETTPAALAFAWLLAQPLRDRRRRRPPQPRAAPAGARCTRAAALATRGRVDRGGVRMSLLVLSADEVERLLDMDACIEAMAEVLASLARGRALPAAPLRAEAAERGRSDGVHARAPRRRARRLFAEGDRGHAGQPDPRARRASGRRAPPRREDGRADGAPERLADHGDPDRGGLGRGNPRAREARGAEGRDHRHRCSGTLARAGAAGGSPRCRDPLLEPQQRRQPRGDRARGATSSAPARARASRCSRSRG